MYVCMYVCMCACMYVRMYVCMYVCVKNTLPSSSLHVKTMPTCVGSRLKDLLTCGRKDCLAAQEHFGVLVLL